jgi:hypothetical protein
MDVVDDDDDVVVVVVVVCYDFQHYDYPYVL